MDEHDGGFGSTQDTFEHERPIHESSFLPRPVKHSLVRFRRAG